MSVLELLFRTASDGNGNKDGSALPVVLYDRSPTLPMTTTITIRMDTPTKQTKQIKQMFDDSTAQH